MSALKTQIARSEQVRPDPDIKKRGLDQRPYFYLIYILFYFAPWFFAPVTLVDIIVGISATVVFSVVYVYSMGRARPIVIAAAVFALSLALGLAPANGTSGTFGIYAVALCASIRPGRDALIAMGIALAVYVGGSLALRFGPLDIFVSVYEVGFTAFICVMAGLAAWSGYNTTERTDLMERRLRLDAELAAVKERERIARDLHDVLGHTLTTIAVKSDLAARLLGSDEVGARREIEEIRDASRASLKEVRAAVAGMHRTSLPVEIERARAALKGVDIRFCVEGDIPALSSQQASALGMALREAVTNVLRHANASLVTARFTATPSDATLTFEDDGGGTAPTPGGGLTGMRSRLETLGGDLSIRTGQSGVQLLMRLPLKPSLENT